MLGQGLGLGRLARCSQAVLGRRTVNWRLGNAVLNCRGQRAALQLSLIPVVGDPGGDTVWGGGVGEEI